MGLFTRRRREPEPEIEPQAEARSYSLGLLGINPMWGTLGGGSSVSQIEAMRNAAYFTCRDILCSSISQTPLDAIRQNGAYRIPVVPTPQLVARPSAVTTLDVWLYQAVGSMIDDGNVFGEITARDSLFRPTQIDLLDPLTVTSRTVEKGIPTVKIGNKDRQLYPYGDVWHCPGRVVLAGTPFGLSLRDAAAGSINAGLAAEKYGRDYFVGGGHPSSIIYNSDPDADEDDARHIKDSFKRATASREPAVMGDGLKYESIQQGPGDTKVLDLLRFEIEQVCRVVRVPPGMAYLALSGQNVTYANVSQADVDYLKHSAETYFFRLETALADLLTRPVIARFNRKAFMRSDPKSRYDIHKLRLETRTATVNEIRADEDEAPFDDPAFDEPGIPGIVLQGKADPLIDPSGTDTPAAVPPPAPKVAP